MQLFTVSSKPSWADDNTSAYGNGCFIGYDDAFGDALIASVDSR